MNRNRLRGTLKQLAAVVPGQSIELGGHSLLATRVVSRLRDRFQIETTPRFLFESPTVAEIASRVSELLVQGINPNEMALMLAELEEQ